MNKTTLTKTLLGTFGFAALLAGGTTTAHAGLKDSNPGTVQIVKYADGSGYAFGMMGAVRSSGDTSAFIGCEVSGYTLNTRYIECKARNAAGTTVTCWQGGIVNNVIQGQPMIDAFGVAAEGSMVDFSFDASGKCTYLNVLTDSSMRPKTL